MQTIPAEMLFNGSMKKWNYNKPAADIPVCRVPLIQSRAPETSFLPETTL